MEDMDLDLLRDKNEAEVKRCMRLFKEDMKKAGLEEPQRRQCAEYVMDYLEDYLVYNDYESSYSVSDGVGLLQCYVKYRLVDRFRMRGNNIKWRCQAIRMFYTSMAKRGLVDQEEFGYMCEEMDDELEGWMQGHFDMDFDPDDFFGDDDDPFYL